MHTVKDLSHKLNVSRVSLYAILKREPFSLYVHRGDNDVIFVKEDGVNLLKEYYISKLKGGTPRNGEEDSQTGSTGVISILYEQLAMKDEQINSLLNIVKNQQDQSVV